MAGAMIAVPVGCVWIRCIMALCALLGVCTQGSDLGMKG